MSHIAVDLKVIEVHAPMVARTLEEPVAVTLGGLSLLWHRCWSTQTTTITRIGLAGIFGMDRIDLRIEALVDAGFLEAADGSFRVRGAEKYLRIREGNSKGGHAAKGNLKRGGTKPAPNPEGEPGGSREGAGREPGNAPGSVPALTPSTEHRAPSTEHRVAAAGPTDIADFWRAAQDERTRVTGLVRERPPHPREQSAWASAAMAEVGDLGRLWAGYCAFLEDPFWRLDAQTRCAWKGWVSQWRAFVPPAPGASPPPVRSPRTTSSTKAPVAAESVDWSTVIPGEVPL